jgi:hypothetical protein
VLVASVNCLSVLKYIQQAYTPDYTRAFPETLATLRNVRPSVRPLGAIQTAVHIFIKFENGEQYEEL